MKYLPILFASFVLVACSGTGEKYGSAVDTQITSEEGTVFITRDSGFGGPRMPVAVALNGIEIGTVDNDETLTARAKKGENIISAWTTKVGSMFYASNEYFFSSDGQTISYFIVSLKNSFFDNRINIAETTEKSRKQSSQD